MFDKTKFQNVDHPDFEVHNFHTLAKKTGWSSTGLANMYAEGVFPMLATNFGKGKNCFAVTKGVVEALIHRKQAALAKKVKSSR